MATVNAFLIGALGSAFLLGTTAARAAPSAEHATKLMRAGLLYVDGPSGHAVGEGGSAAGGSHDGSSAASSTSADRRIICITTRSAALSCAATTSSSPGGSRPTFDSVNNGSPLTQPEKQCVTTYNNHVSLASRSKTRCASASMTCRNKAKDRLKTCLHEPLDVDF